MWPYLDTKKPEKCNYLAQLKIRVSTAPKEEKIGLRRELTVPIPAICIEFLPPILPNSLLFYAITNTSKSGSPETFQARNLSVSLSFIFFSFILHIQAKTKFGFSYLLNVS